MVASVISYPAFSVIFGCKITSLIQQLPLSRPVSTP